MSTEYQDSVPGAGRKRVLRPARIERIDSDQGTGLRISWSEEETTELGGRLLRTHCPCAACREKRGDESHSKPLVGRKPSSLRVVEASAEEETSLEQVWAVGNYAVGLRWRDGHDDGIYTFSLLRELSERTKK